MRDTYDPKQYWERRLTERFSLRGVGHIRLTENYNNCLYRRKRACISSCLAGTNLKGLDVLDIGCGTGFFVDWYRSMGAVVCGLDITCTSIERLKQQFPCEFYTQDISEKDYLLHGRKFDIVNMWDVVYHIVDTHRFEQAFENIAGNLKEGGLLLFTDRFGASSDVRNAEHVHTRCMNTYRECLTSKGLELVKVVPLYNFLNKIRYKKIDDRLGWLYLFLDNRAKKVPADNLSLGVWRLKGD